eukprot:gene22787-29955_t
MDLTRVHLMDHDVQDVPLTRPTEDAAASASARASGPTPATAGTAASGSTAAEAVQARWRLQARSGQAGEDLSLGAAPLPAEREPSFHSFRSEAEEDEDDDDGEEALRRRLRKKKVRILLEGLNQGSGAMLGLQELMTHLNVEAAGARISSVAGARAAAAEQLLVQPSPEATPPGVAASGGADAGVGGGLSGVVSGVGVGNAGEAAAVGAAGGAGNTAGGGGGGTAGEEGGSSLASTLSQVEGEQMAVCGASTAGQVEGESVAVGSGSAPFSSDSSPLPKFSGRDRDAHVEICTIGSLTAGRKMLDMETENPFLILAGYITSLAF